MSTKSRAQLSKDLDALSKRVQTLSNVLSKLTTANAVLMTKAFYDHGIGSMDDFETMSHVPVIPFFDFHCYSDDEFSNLTIENPTAPHKTVTFGADMMPFGKLEFE